MPHGTMTGELGAFLRSRRDRLTPESVGIAPYGRRRVPGLRRDELAQLAGISVTYLTRLEQGQSANASASVIDALARALRLDEAEHRHLHALARPAAAPRAGRPRPERAAPSMLALMAAMGDLPAVLMGRRTDVLAWTPLGHALLAGHHPPDAPERAAARPNLTRMLFLDPHTRALYARWREEAARAVASLRLVAGEHRDDPGLAELIGELVLKSPEFCALWSKHPVKPCVAGRKALRHPEVGRLELDFQVLQVPDGTGQRLLTFTAPPGSDAAAALALLGR
jgi:transcriptional regulator with XRE-family HTH domain